MKEVISIYGFKKVNLRHDGIFHRSEYRDPYGNHISRLIHPNFKWYIGVKLLGCQQVFQDNIDLVKVFDNLLTFTRIK